jgi:tetratricopeptide (TPR) repeat protein
MLAADAAGANAAIERMAAALSGWETARASGAVPLLDDEIAEAPSLPLAAYADGFARMGRGEYREALPSLRAAAAAPAGEWAQLAAAGRLAQQEKDDEAERALRAIVEAFPASGVAHWWLGRVYERLNKAGDARREYQTVVSMALTGRAPLYAAIGRLARVEGEFAAAAEALERRLRLTPQDPVAHKDVARVYLDQGLTEQSLAAFQTAIAIEPRDADAHAAIGRIRLDAGQPAEAIAALRRALELVPQFFEARYPLALALRQTGRPDEAARELELFERGSREATEARRRTMAAEVDSENAARRDFAR